ETMPQQGAAPAEEAAARLGALLPDSLGPGWTEWEPVAGEAPLEALVVIRQHTLPWTGLALTALLSLGFWRAGGRRRLGLLLLWLAGSSLALLWFPPALSPLARWPFLAGGVTALLWYLVWAARGPALWHGLRPGHNREAAKRSVATAGVLTLLCCAVAWSETCAVAWSETCAVAW